MSESVRLLPPGMDLGFTDEPIRADAWKNLVFDRDGRSHLAKPIYHTTEAAWLAAEDALRQIRAMPPDNILVYPDGEQVTAGDVMRAIQIPWNRP